jgi:drug/metabolite transporter (DMT)-like permease
MFRGLSLSALAAVICWAAMAPFAKYAFDSFSADAYLGLRPIIATATAFAVMAARGVPLKISRPAWPRLLLCGAIGYGIAQIGFVKGLDLTSVSHHSVLVATSPLIAALILPILHRTRPHGPGLAGMLLGFAGVALLVGGGGTAGSSIGGDAFVLLSAAVWVGATIWPIPLMARYGVETVNAWMLALSLMVIVPLTAPDLKAVVVDPPGWVAWTAVAYGGIVGVLLGNVLWHRAVREVGLDAAMVYQYLTPLLSLALAIAFLGERPTVIQGAGSVLILAGVAIVRSRQAREAEVALDEAERRALVTVEA